MLGTIISSNLSFYDSNIINSQASKALFDISNSQVYADGLLISNVTSDQEVQPSIFRLIECRLNFENSHFNNAVMSAIEATFSPLNLVNTTFKSISSHNGLIRTWSSPEISLDGINISNLTSSSPLFYLQDSVITEFKDSLIQVVDRSPLTVKKGTVESIRNVKLINSQEGFVFIQSNVSQIES